MALTRAKMEKLGASLIGEKVNDDSTLAEIEKSLPLTESYRRVLLDFGGGVFFDKGALFIPDKPIPFADSNGKLGISMLFGLGRDRFSILDNLNTFKDQLEVGSVPMGDDPFGNLIISDEYGEVYFWDHETGRVYGVAPSLDDFFSRLEPSEEA